MATKTAKIDSYDESYKRQNYFGYRSWIYAPYVSSLIAHCGLKRGACVLDIGCGQGFFSYLFNKCGMRVHGVDLSETGIRTAESLYGRFGVTFAVADIQSETFPEAFDCIFVRSCSLYNTDTFSTESDVTSDILRHLKPDGIFIFAYNSNFSSKASPKWRYHSLEEVQRHFRSYPNAEIFFLNKITTYLLREYSINTTLTRFNSVLSRISGMGGDIVCILRNRRSVPVTPSLAGTLDATDVRERSESA